MTEPAKSIRLLTIGEAAETQPTWTLAYLRRTRCEGRLHAVRHGRNYLIDPRELERFARWPDKESPRASGNAATARGSSSTLVASTGQALLMVSVNRQKARLRTT